MGHESVLGVEGSTNKVVRTAQVVPAKLKSGPAMLDITVNEFPIVSDFSAPWLVLDAEFMILP